MSSQGDPVPTGTEGEESVRRVAGQRPVATLNCSRIGRVANPPGFSIAEWFRSPRRR